MSHRRFAIPAAVVLLIRAITHAAMSTSTTATSLTPFEASQVQLLDGPVKRAFDLNVQYLRSLSPDRFLWTFRRTAGLPAEGEPYGGWEAPSCELRGHSMGHYLSACARIIAATGDHELRGKADYTVAELARCQQRHGNGYLSAFPEEFFDRVEQSRRVWAPYYTIHKIMVGLWEMHTLAGNRQALDVLKGMAGYFRARCDRLDDAQMQAMLRNEFGGMHEVLLNLYSTTGDKAHLDLAERFVKRSFIDPLAAGKDCLPGLHANTHIPQVAGQARAYEVKGDARCRRVVEVFYDALMSAHSYATGGSNVGEHWGPPNRLADTISATNQEFCTCYNHQKICRYLLRWTADARYADMLERTFYNGILVSQHPRTGMFIYFLPLKPGLRKSHGTPFDTFTCCYGTGMQAYAALWQDIYWHDADSLYVNLYVSSSVSWRRPAGDVKVVQTTGYPASPQTTLRLTVQKPAALRLMLRVPWWATGGVALKVNGQPVSDVSARAGSWLPVSRTWNDGDTVELTMPMSLTVAPINDDRRLGAIMYGPLVLAGLVDTPESKYPDMPVPVLTGDMAAPDRWLKRVEGDGIVFRTAGQPHDMTFVPIHEVVDQRYGIYWRFVEPTSPELAEYGKTIAAVRDRERRTIDIVAVGDPQSEKAHDMQGADTASGTHAAGRWRHAGATGFFSYRMKVRGDRENALAVTYWGDDAGRRIFDILVDDTRIATQKLERNAPGRLFVVEYPVPRKLTDGKDAVVVRFQIGEGGQTVGGIFGLATVLAATPEGGGR